MLNKPTLLHLNQYLLGILKGVLDFFYILLSYNPKKIKWQQEISTVHFQVFLHRLS